MRPAGAVLRRADYIVEVSRPSVAAELVYRWHYAAGASNTAVACHVLRRRDDAELLGVAWWIPPTKPAAVSTYPEGDWRRVLALSRLVVAPDVPANGASFLLGRSERLVRAMGAWDCLVTYADEGQGHTGAIYRATNWQYLGLTRAEHRWTDADGRMVARKRGPSTIPRTAMLELGYRRSGPYRKHKFRKVIR